MNHLYNIRLVTCFKPLCFLISEEVVEQGRDARHAHRVAQKRVLLPRGQIRRPREIIRKRVQPRDFIDGKVSQTYVVRAIAHSPVPRSLVDATIRHDGSGAFDVFEVTLGEAVARRVFGGDYVYATLGLKLFIKKI